MSFNWYLIFRYLAIKPISNNHTVLKYASEVSAEIWECNGQMWETDMRERSSLLSASSIWKGTKVNFKIITQMSIGKTQYLIRHTYPSCTLTFVLSVPRIFADILVHSFLILLQKSFEMIWLNCLHLTVWLPDCLDAEHRTQLLPTITVTVSSCIYVFPYLSYFVLLRIPVALPVAGRPLALLNHSEEQYSNADQRNL